MIEIGGCSVKLDHISGIGPVVERFEPGIMGFNIVIPAIYWWEYRVFVNGVSLSESFPHDKKEEAEKDRERLLNIISRSGTK